MRNPSPTPAVLNAIRARIEQLEAERSELIQILAQQGNPVPQTPKQPKRATMTTEPQRPKMSEEGRKRISAAAKNRWAKQKAQDAKPNGKKTQAAGA